MGQILHGSATTTEAVRRAIQHSQESLIALSKIGFIHLHLRCPAVFSILTLSGMPFRGWLLIALANHSQLGNKHLRNADRFSLG